MFKPENSEKYTQSNYMKFEVGQNKIRMLSQPITGYEWWIDANENIVPRGQRGGEGAKPVRAKAEQQFTNKEIGAMKMFAAMSVWNYNLERVQILEITQVKIMNALNALEDSKSWGDVTDYDIIITKEKTGPNTYDVSYSVMPEPKTPLAENIVDTLKDKKIRLEALYAGEDPFEDTDDVDVDEVAEEMEDKSTEEIAEDLDGKVA